MDDKADRFEDLTRRLLERASAHGVPRPDPAAAGWTHAGAGREPTLAAGSIRFNWEIRAVEGEPRFSFMMSCDPPLDQADIVFLLRHEADTLNWEPDGEDEPTYDET